MTNARKFVIIVTQNKKADYTFYIGNKKMSTINTTKASQKATIEAHTNHMEAPSFDIKSPLNRLRMMAASCFFGEPQYYVDGGMKSRAGKVNSGVSKSQMDHLVDVLMGIVTPQETDGKTTVSVMEEAIDRALDVDVEGTLKIAVALRNEDMIRTTPQVILVRAANHKNAKGTGLIRKYAKDITKRADEPSVQMAYHIHTYGKTIPNALKKAWKDVLESLSEFQLAKYRMESRRVKTIDVVRMAHAHSDAIDKLVYDKLKLDNNTWESLISAKGSNKETWTEAVDKMGHMALLRNLRNLTQNDVDKDLFTQKLIDGVEKGKQLPFRYYNAYNMLKQANAPLAIQAAVEQCMEVSVANLPRFEGNVAALCDNSGSAHGTLTSSAGTVRVSTIANLTAVLTGMVTEGNATVYPFGDRLKSIKIDKSKGIFAQTDAVEKLAKTVGGGTETGVWLFWDNAIKNKQHLDHVFVYSDMQAGHGGLFTNDSNAPTSKFAWNNGRSYGRNTYVDVPALIAEYRKQVNPNVQVYLVQVAGYGDTIVPEIYDKTYILGGWSSGILNFAHKVSTLNP